MWPDQVHSFVEAVGWRIQRKQREDTSSMFVALTPSDCCSAKKKRDFFADADKTAATLYRATQGAIKQNV